MDNDLAIARCLAGETSVYGTIVCEYAPLVYKRVLQSVRDPDEADDLVQEVFITAFLRLPQLRDPASLEGWLIRIADSQIAGWFRRRHRQLDLVGRMGRGEGEADSQPTLDEIRSILRSALTRLTHVHREAVAYHYYKGYSYEQTGVFLDLSEDQVRSRLQKARKRLSKEVRSMDGDVPKSERHTLGKGDLAALNWGMRYASSDESRPLLRALCIDTGGRIVATDGHRLLLWQSEGLSANVAPAVFGPVDGEAIHPATCGTLEIGGQEVHIMTDSGQKLSFDQVHEPYVKYEEVIPVNPTFALRVDLQSLRDVVDKIERFLGGMHPVRDGEWEYAPIVEIRVSGEAATLSLTTQALLGYSRVCGEGPRRVVPGEMDPRDVPEAGKAHWSFSASVDVAIKEGQIEGLFRMGINHSYLADG